MSTEAPAVAADAPTEDVVAKYKRLLSMARSSLEANQSTLAQKDRHISQLLQALEEEKLKRASQRGQRHTSGREEDAQIPRNLLRRVDADSVVWVLIEYEGADDGWVSFSSQQELEDYVQRIPGAPLEIPPRSLSPDESVRLEAESKKKLDRIVEEFRRYKVRSEIDKKNKEAEMRQAAIRGQTLTSTSSSSSSSSSTAGLSLPALMERSLAEGIASDDGLRHDEIHRIKTQMAEQEAKWRQAYEKVVKENEMLRTRGGEAVLATQWRERYENSQRERDEMSEKLQLLTKTSLESSGGMGSPDGKIAAGSLQQAYAELKEEYRDFRRRVQADQKRRAEEMSPREDRRDDSFELGSIGGGGGGGGAASSPTSPIISGLGLRTMGMGESKIQYVKQMVFQYLSCRDPVVRPHIESALVAIFRYNELERAQIDERKKEESLDTITSITNMLGTGNVSSFFTWESST